MKTMNIDWAEQPRGLLIGVIALVVFFAAGVWWLLQPSWVALFQNESEAARTEVTALLAKQGIAYRQAKDGAIEVLQGDVDAARRQLVDAGLPSKQSTGFEIFDNADYGMSEFAQKINYQRALEGELARSIMSLREVRAARVHLTLRKNSLYAAQQEAAKASVVLQLHTGMLLDKKQVFGIQQLVAASVEGLKADAVVVIDEAGLPLNGDQNFGAFDDRWQLASRVEAELQAKAQQVLDNIYGASNARASVRVQMNFDRVKAVKELPVPGDAAGNNVVLREKQLQSSDNRKDTEGASNGRQQQTDEIEYVVGKDHSEIEYSPGRIERITVGVVVSDKLANVDAKALGELLGATLGINEQRGDRLSIALMPMQALPADAALPPVATAQAQASAAGTLAVPLPWWLLLAGVVLGGALATLLLRNRKPQTSPQPVVSPAEREQLLADLRNWLGKDRGEDLS
jgi:flagellar M-ring protein FliF